MIYLDTTINHNPISRINSNLFNSNPTSSNRISNNLISNSLYRINSNLISNNHPFNSHPFNSSLTPMAESRDTLTRERRAAPAGLQEV